MEKEKAFLQQIRRWCNAALSDYEPLLIVIVALVAGAIFPILYASISSAHSLLQEHGLLHLLMKIFFQACRKIPGINNYIQKQQAKVIDKLSSSGKSQRDGWTTELPKIGHGEGIFEHLKSAKARDKLWQGKCSGTVYIGGSEADAHFALLDKAYSMFAHTNPLHADVFPSVSRFEAEVVAMVASMLGSLHPSSGGQVCGNMTSGGTESILMAVKTTRDYMKATKGITSPEMIIPTSAHSAYDKAAQYFGIRLKRAAVGKDFRVDIRSVERLINSNTIMIVGSSPGYPHGVIDPIQELGVLALRHRICFHVDLCLGGFVLPFAQKLGYPIPPFDFTVAGVTSISIDVHKYGLGPKGTSTVLYRTHDIRKHQFVAVTEWSGGLYISPSMAGSRSGALIAAAWAAMMALGEEGYMKITKKLMEASERIKEGTKEISGLYVVGEPSMTVIAFASDVYDIYKVNDVMSKKGWSLNALQKPPSFHLCVTLQHVDVVDKFIEDLTDAALFVKENPNDEEFKEGMAPIYGAAGRMPDRGAIEDILVAYMDSTC